jgi:hypothetical protein
LDKFLDDAIRGAKDCDVFCRKDNVKLVEINMTKENGYYQPA